MAEFTQLPGELNLTFVQGDQVKVNCDFDVNVTGYTVTNSVYVTDVYASDGGGSGFITTIGATVTTFDQTVTNAANGQILLDLPENKSALLTPGVGYRWYLRWMDTSSVTRTVLSGTLTVVNP
jgi:hypothetical protein